MSGDGPSCWSSMLTIDPVGELFTLIRHGPEPTTGAAFGSFDVAGDSSVASSGTGGLTATAGFGGGAGGGGAGSIRGAAAGVAADASLLSLLPVAARTITSKSRLAPAAIPPIISHR